MTNEWDALPDNTKTFLTALDAREVDRALATFTPDAVVTDEGRDYTGRDEIGAWLTAAAAEYTYTTEFMGATATDTTVEARQHLEGDFPGGVADLRYRFALDGALISRLVIEP
ncbi:ketosteroid isomerase-like protein [Mycolicibacterium sp. BK556]|uniref:nuclear transport factor 2 family protein n=1 Tax=Mycobacteriaceae TaxID=1762 RepID=UPI00106106D4|nr:MULTISPECIES: nuclear transport factor 2 family protein [Mycobacteriaceae]MBB3600430.1 ketosteroid isomerase-like protein [Mycolicibacterium sp. BK556]MBB3630182.1 ketosteroid isomerase-like protein [Mycolicibacterium sp. BK607]TDO09975.1 SnoaL-like protein [Mycobacterium sp. BK086]